MSDAQNVEPKDINYDKPLDLMRLYSEPVPMMIKCSVLWCDILSVEEYPDYYNESTNWGNYKDTDKCYVTLGNLGTCIVATGYDYMMKYWTFYRQHIYVDSCQLPHGLRKDKIK